jgi:hypothetical protein
VAAGGDNEMPLIAATVLLGVALISLAAQGPLWITRQWLGWRLVRERVGRTVPTATASRWAQSTLLIEAPQPEPPLTIRDLMVATLVVAASLALARLAPAWEDARALWAAWGIASTVASLISSIALLPAGALLLRSRRFSRGLVWSCFYATGWIALAWILVAVFRWYGVLLPPRAVFVGLSSLMVTFAATVMLTGAIARDRGYRLASGRKR